MLAKIDEKLTVNCKINDKTSSENSQDCQNKQQFLKDKINDFFFVKIDFMEKMSIYFYK